MKKINDFKSTFNLTNCNTLHTMAAFCQVWFGLAQWFWRNRPKCKKFATITTKNDDDVRQWTNFDQERSSGPLAQVSKKSYLAFSTNHTEYNDYKYSLVGL